MAAGFWLTATHWPPLASKPITLRADHSDSPTQFAPTSTVIAKGERDWKEGTEALQANRPLEARRALDSAASHYSKAIELEKRRVRR